MLGTLQWACMRCRCLAFAALGVIRISFCIGYSWLLPHISNLKTSVQWLGSSMILRKIYATTVLAIMITESPILVPL
jgi:hypothetical protein